MTAAEAGSGWAAYGTWPSVHGCRTRKPCGQYHPPATRRLDYQTIDILRNWLQNPGFGKYSSHFSNLAQMLSFATFDDLLRFKGDFSESAQIMKRAKFASSKSTFLSHSSKDEALLPGVIKVLENHGASVYCDLDDARMPPEPSPATAAILKKQIKDSRHFVVFVTPNSKDSKWVPWELGVGDEALGNVRCSLFPAAPTSYDQLWAKQEYLGLYRQIVYGQLDGYQGDVWMVLDHSRNLATELSQWFKQ